MNLNNEDRVPQVPENGRNRVGLLRQNIQSCNGEVKIVDFGVDEPQTFVSVGLLVTTYLPPKLGNMKKVTYFLKT